MVNVKIQITTQRMIQVVGSQKQTARYLIDGTRNRAKSINAHQRDDVLGGKSHLTEPLTLKEIAASVHLSPRECQRIFKAYLHRTPMEYLQWRRILAAADDLRNTNEEIMSIALNYQFSSPGYFSKRFKGYTGLTPTEYRR